MTRSEYSQTFGPKAVECLCYQLGAEINRDRAKLRELVPGFDLQDLTPDEIMEKASAVMTALPPYDWQTGTDV